MKTKFILVMSVSSLLFCGSVSASTGKLNICGQSTYGFEENFTIIASNLGYRVDTFPGKCDLKTTFNVLSKAGSGVVINFDVINPGDYYLMNTELNEYEGDMILNPYGILNKSLPICTDDSNHTDVYDRTCRDPFFNAHTTLFKGSFEEHLALYNVFNDITNNLIDGDYVEKDRVKKLDYVEKQILLCSDSCQVYHENGFFTYCKRCDTQFECHENTIAIIAPSPEKLKTCDENIPVIFYDTVYVEPNDVGNVYEDLYTSDFITSTTMMHWKALASGLRGYLNTYSWPRVAIVSDDSLLSHYMTNDQEKYFEDRNALFTIIRNCNEERDFKEALTFLKKFDSRIIIVNVAKQNLNKFIAGAQAAGVRDADIIWVFPGHRDTDIKDFKFRYFVHLTYDLEKVVQFVIKTYKESLGVETRFKERIRNNRPLESCEESHGTARPTNSITAKSIPNRLPPMGLGNCALRRSDYFHYCADWMVLYIILAIIVFLLLVFAVLLFFNHIQLNTLAYKPLHKPPSLWRQLLRRERPRPRQGFPLRRRY